MSLIVFDPKKKPIKVKYINTEPQQFILYSINKIIYFVSNKKKQTN